MIDVKLRISKDVVAKINRMNKKELINCIVVDILRSKVQDETIAKLEAAIELSKRNEKATQARLDKAKTCIRQSQTMINSIMSSWL